MQTGHPFSEIAKKSYFYVSKCLFGLETFPISYNRWGVWNKECARWGKII